LTPAAQTTSFAEFAIPRRVGVRHLARHQRQELRKVNRAFKRKANKFLRQRQREAAPPQLLANKVQYID